MVINEAKNKKERVLLVAVSVASQSKTDVIESLEELELLSKSAGAEVVEKIVQVRKAIDPKFYIGKGKIHELAPLISEKSIDTVIMDNEISPIQIRNMENILECKVIGRIELILDIFARRAKTREAKLQVEYAQLLYMMPRLRRRWTHLSRIEGGIGFRGPGETQLEIDRRIIKKRIASIKKELEKISVQMDNRRKRRMDKDIVSLIGYTNAGKSTLLNLLAKDNLFTEDLLFATLDPSIRKVYVSKDTEVLLVDTVGFIRNLPHQLIVSFKSTLDEIKYSELLLHVVDITSENYNERIQNVQEVLKELECLEKPTIYVFNKVDAVDDSVINLSSVKELYPNSCFVSAKDGTGKDELLKAISEYFSKEIDIGFYQHKT